MEAEFVLMSLELNVECPNCEDYFDLFNIPELTDEGFLYDLVCTNNGFYAGWGCKDFQKRLDDNDIEIRCPRCKTKITIESVNW